MYTGISIQKPRYDILGFVLIYFISVLVIMVPQLPFLMVYLKIDMFYLIHLALTNCHCIMDCSSNLLNAEKVTFVVLLGIFFLVLSKLMFISAYICSLVLFHIQNYCYTLNKLDNRFGETLLLKYYFRSLLFIRNTEQIISQLMLFFIICTQIYLTLLAWINCGNILPSFFIFASGSGFVGGLIFCVLILRLALHTAVYSSDLVEKKRAQFFGCNQVKRHYYYTAKWNACKEVGIGFGSLFKINKDVITIYLEVLSTNITDAVLLIVP